MSAFLGRPFYKMSGSGNDFVVFDTRGEPAGELKSQRDITTICARGTGVGADGAVFLVDHPEADIGLHYYNADGLPASLCGNATLCIANLAVTLGCVDPSGFRIATDAGVVQARIRDNLPEFDLPAVADVQPDYQSIGRVSGETRLGYAMVGVPHIVIQVQDISMIDIVGRSRPIRHDPSLPFGANVNFVSRRPDGRWAIRTYERGVEDETLACGTGNVAAAVLLRIWDEANGDVELLTKSGRTLKVRLRRDQGGWHPSLNGEGRLVFRGEIVGL
jgi:diaminopimelate epimerase